jgi:hypothetical protein
MLNTTKRRILLPEAQKFNGDEYYCFLQDGRYHTQQTSFSGDAKIIWIISKDEWPPSSPDLNLLDFSIWGYMLWQLRNYKYATLPEFKKIIQLIRANISEHFASWSKPKNNLLNNWILNKKKIILISFLRKKVKKLLFCIHFRLSPCI